MFRGGPFNVLLIGRASDIQGVCSAFWLTYLTSLLLFPPFFKNAHVPLCSCITWCPCSSATMLMDYLLSMQQGGMRAPKKHFWVHLWPKTTSLTRTCNSMHVSGCTAAAP
eukprot:1161716-Pelagomonas_calceolata.AAC.5